MGDTSSRQDLKSAGCSSYSKLFYSWLTFWDSGSFSKKEVEIITTSPSRKNSDIIYFTSVFFSISVSKNLFLKIIFCFFIILSNHFGLDHALGFFNSIDFFGHTTCRPICPQHFRLGLVEFFLLSWSSKRSRNFERRSTRCWKKTNWIRVSGQKCRWRSQCLGIIDWCCDERSGWR